ncbi:MAG: metal ABC transporter ATP-binding protein [Desulfobacterales bacterium]|nr:metal ABC transporter ATP-binding protein [Desulfobacterales bacterium]
MNQVLSILNITISFGINKAVDNFSVDLYQGDFLALLGANGSGKTTILRSIIGFIKPTKGIITLFGTPATTRTYKELRKRIGYVPQTAHVDFRMPISVEEVVSIGRYGKLGMGKRLSPNDKDLIQKSMKEVGILHLSQRPIGHLSGGERQKVQIARVLCQNPDLLLLDEPTANLDLGAQSELIDLLEKIYEQKRISILIVMHDLQNLPRKCNRSIIISEGNKVFDGKLKDIFNIKSLSYIYGPNTDLVLRSLSNSIEGIP